MRVLIFTIFGFLVVSCCIPCRQSAPTLGVLETGVWRLVEFEQSALTSSPITLRFDANEKMMYGTAACNNFFGGYTLSEDSERNISFLNVGATLMYCPDSELEGRFTAVLPAIVELKIDGGHLMLVDSLGELRAIMRHELVK